MSDLDARTYGFWFVRLIDRIGLGWVGGAFIVALLPYLLGLLLVIPFGDAGLYLRTPAFYMGFAGLMLVMAASVRGIEILAKGISELQGVAVDRAEFHAYVDSRLRAAAQDRSNAVLLVPFVAGAIVLVAAALHRWHRTGVVPVGHQFHAFLVDWRAPDALVPVGLALCVFALPVAIATGTSVVLLVRNLPFIWRLRSFRYLPFPGRIRLRVRTLVTAYAWVSGTWAVGVTLFALFFFKQWSGLNVIGISALAAIGLATLAVPYSTFRKILDNSHEEMAAQLARGAKMEDGGVIAGETAAEFATINSAIIADPPPVLTRRSAVAYGFVQLLALGSLLAKGVLQEQVTFLAREPTTPKKRSGKNEGTKSQ